MVILLDPIHNLAETRMCLSAARILLVLTTMAFPATLVSGQAQNDLLPPVPSTSGTVLPAISARPKVNVVYLVPSDRVVRQDYASALSNAIRSLRDWYGKQMPLQRTFDIADPAVHVVSLSNPAAWYAENPRAALFTQFWENVLSDAFALTGGDFNDPQNIWAYYIDADPACGQCGGCGTSGVLVIGANDLRGFTGQPWQPTCPGDFDTGGPARFIGGLGHELGHAFGLPHPPGCDQGSAECDHAALMWNGFRQYPDTYLRVDEIAVLNRSPFFMLPPSARRRAVRH
jgi:hypothetical protein